MPSQLGIERWYPLAHALPGEEASMPLGDPFAAVLPDMSGPSGPSTSDADDEAEDRLGLVGDESYWINQATGNLCVRIALPEMGGLPTPVVLTYNLQDTVDRGAAGAGWVLNVDERLSTSATAATLTSATGSQRVYSVSGGVGTPPAGIYNSLALQGDGSWLETQRNGKQKSYVSGYLDHVVDRTGSRWTMGRDANHSLTAMLDPTSHTFTLNRGANGYIASVQDPGQRLTSLTYDASNRLSAIQKPDGSRVTFAYSGSSSQMVSIQDPDGYLVTFALDNSGPSPVVSGVYDAVGAHKSMAYSSGQCVVIDPLNQVWTALLDASSRLSVYTDPQNRATSLTWDANNNLVNILAPLNRSATFLYNTQGRLTFTSDPMAAITTIGYSADGKWPILRTDPTGATIQAGYDPATNDRVLCVDEDANRTSYTYNQFGQHVSQSDVVDGIPILRTRLYYGFASGGAGGALTYDSPIVYDSANAYDGVGGYNPTLGLYPGLEVSADPLGGGAYAYTTYGQDAFGYVNQVVDADQRTMTYLNSPMGRRLASIDAIGRRTTFNYDGRGNPVSTVDPLGHRWTSVYDGRSRITASIDPLLNITSFGYDLAGSHTLTIDAAGAVTTNIYSPGRDLQQVIDPLLGVTQYNRDGAGRALFISDPTSRLVSFGYDLSDRTTQQIIYPAAGSPQTTNLGYTPRDELQTHVDPTGWRTSMSYWGRPGLTKTTQGTGQSGPATSSLAYVSTGGVKSAVDPLGNSTVNLYSGAARVSATQDALGYLTSYVYSPAGDVINIINARGAITTLQYDILHRPVVRQVSPRPGVLLTSTTAYDDAGRVSQEIYPDGTSMVYGYFDNGWLQVEVDPMGGRTSYTYTPRGQIKTTQDAEGRITTLGYDLQGRHTLTIDAAGFSTTFGYDLSDNHTYTIDPLGNRVTYVYDGANRPIETHVSPGGVEYITAQAYDGAGRVTMTTFPDGTTYGYNWQFPGGDGFVQESDELQHVRTRFWNKAGLTYKEVDPLGNIVYSQAYDALNRVYFVQSQRAVNAGPAQATHSFAYDEVSNRVAVIDALGNRQTALFDYLNRPTTMVRSTGSVLLTTSEDYNARGSVQYRTDARGNTVSLFYDLNQRMIASQDPLAAYTSFSYDRTGRRIAVQAPPVAAGSAITSMTYEPRGLLTTLTYADLSQEQFQYDGAGRQTVHILPDGSRVSSGYDNMARLLQIIPPPGQNAVSQAWDARSRRVLMMDRTGNLGFQYYPDGRVQSVQAAAGLVTYVYDAAGRRTGMTYAAGSTQIGYDVDNNLVSVQNPFSETANFAWDLASRLTSMTLGNGSIVSLRYDDANRLVYIGDNSTTGLGFAYALDANGNRITITENDGSQVNNTYDAKNRLTLEVRTGTSAYSNGYSYDLNNSLIAARGNSYAVDIMGRITNSGFVYDSNGRLTTRPGTDGTTHLSYDYAGRVTSLTLANGFTIVYGLDGDGTLRSETRAGKRFDMVLDGKDVLRESNVTVTLTPSGGSVALRPRDLVRLPGATATYIRDITDYTYGLGLISQRTTVSRFFRWDGIGSLRNLEDNSRNIVASSVFDAYGLQQNAITLASAYGFIGEEGVRGEKGLSSSTLVPQNMRARMYDPLTGRFTSRDPVWDKNLYEYGNGNPWSYTDADGRQAILFHARLRALGINPDDVDPPRYGRAWTRILDAAHFDSLSTTSQAQIVEDLLDVYVSPRAGNRPRNPEMSGLPPEVVKFWMDLLFSQVRDLGSEEFSGDVASAQRKLEGLNSRYPMSSSTRAAIWPETLRVAKEQGKDLQGELEIIAIVPGPVGEIASLGAAGIAFARGDRVSAGLDLLGAIPLGKLFGVYNKASRTLRFGIRVGSGLGSDYREATVVREIARQETISTLVLELKELTFTTGLEHGVVRLENGQRLLIAGGESGFHLGRSVPRVAGRRVQRFIVHTHPFERLPTGPSPQDLSALRHFGSGGKHQLSAYLIERGQVYKYTESGFRELVPYDVLRRLGVS